MTCKERILSPLTSEDTKWEQAERRKQAISVGSGLFRAFKIAIYPKNNTWFFSPFGSTEHPLGRSLSLFKEYTAELQCPEFVPNRVDRSWGRESVRDSGDVVGKDTTLANTMRSH